MKTLNLSIPGLSIACKIWGNPINPPIIALHGWMDNANSFDYLAEYFQHEYYFIAVDLPGHGLSSHLPVGCHYHFIDGIFVVIQIINALKLDKVHLLGHSMGACLGSLVAGIAPDRFLSLCLIEGLGPHSHPEKTACKQLSNYANVLANEEILKHRVYNHMNGFVIARARSGHVSMDIAKKLCERGVKDSPEGLYWSHDRRLKVPSPLYLTEQQILSCLKKITTKTYLLWASKGFPFDSNLIKIRMKAVKNLETKQLEGGHHIHMEQPEAVCKLLADFYHSS